MSYTVTFLENGVELANQDNDAMYGVGPLPPSILEGISIVLRDKDDINRRIGIVEDDNGT